MKQEQEKTWRTSTNRTMYQRSEVSKTKSDVNTTKQTAWTQAIRNRMRQKAGEIQVYRSYRRMLWVNSETFPTNAWIHKITKGKESDRCDLCRDLWITEDRFRTEKDLPEQTVGHIQHTCEALSATHIDAHHQCW
jgi:hypothetical protein